MKLKTFTNKKSFYLIVISICLFLIGLMTGIPEWFGLCQRWDFECYDFYSYNFGFFGWLILIAPLLFFFGLMSWVKNHSEKVFTAWWKFARVYIPIALFLILISGGTGMLGGLGGGGGFDREGTIWFTTGLFFIISMIIIPLKFRKYKK